MNQVHQLLVTAPEDLRARLRPLARTDLISTCAGLRISPDDDSVQAMIRPALREVAQRTLHLTEQLAVVGKRLARITAAVAPKLMAIKGVGPEVASTLLMTAGDNPQRMHSGAAFAALCGANPIPASSGKTNRHRLKGPATGKPTPLCGASSSSGSGPTREPATTWRSVSPKARARPKRSAA